MKRDLYKAKLFLLTLATAAGTASAQNAIVNDRPGTFVDISSMGATPLVNGGYLNNDFREITTTVTNSVFAATEVGVCSNGFIQFGGDFGFFDAQPNNSTIAAGTSSPVFMHTTQTLFPYWDDLFFPEDNGGEIYWKEDTATAFGLPAALGNVLIVQWNNAPHYDGGGISTNVATFQVQIYQNIIGNVAAQMIYLGTVFDNTDFDSGASATIGFAAGTTGGPGSANNVLYAYNTPGSVTGGTVLSLLANVSPTLPTVTTPPMQSRAEVGDSILFAVAVAPGTLPTSTGIAVHGDLTAVGGPANVVFHDDGLNGDAEAGDNIFSYSYTIPASYFGGPQHVPVVVTDAQGRTVNASVFAGIVWNIGTIGATAVSKTLTVGGPGEVQWLKFTTAAGCDPVTNYLDIDTEGSVLTGMGNAPDDTWIGLFAGDGTLIANDWHSGSGNLSQLSFGAVGSPRPSVGDGLEYTGTDGANGTAVTAGTYYLAVGLYFMQFDTPFIAVHTDSPRTVGSTGTIHVNFNSNLPGGGGCGPADLGSVGGVPGADGHLDNNDFIAFISYFFNSDSHADVGVSGGLSGHDGLYDNNDFIAFINHFFAGCP